MTARAATAGRHVAEVLVDSTAAAAGSLLAAVFGSVARLRGTRPLHPRGETYAATVTNGGQGSSGVPWLDEAATTQAELRFSRATGLPRPYPDIHGIALRVFLGGDAAGATRCADLLFASTGDSAYGRFVLAPRRSVADGPLTTLLPVRAPSGPLLLRLSPDAAPEPGNGAAGPVPARMTLSYAVGTGPWTPVATVVVGEPLAQPREAVRHDAVTAVLPGTEQYGVVARLREPAYRAAREAEPEP